MRNQARKIFIILKNWKSHHTQRVSTMKKTATIPTLPPPKLKLRPTRATTAAILLAALLPPNASAFTTLSLPVSPPSLARIAATRSSVRLAGRPSSSDISFLRRQSFPPSSRGVGFVGIDARIRSLPPSGRIDRRSKSALHANLIPYDELMERLPSKTVLEAVEKANGAPIVASGKNNFILVCVCLHSSTQTPSNSIFFPRIS